MKVIFIIMALILGSVIYAATSEPAPVYRTIEYTVQEGDTVYNLAAHFAKPEENINEKSYQISKENNVKNGMIQPGQKLVIHIKE